MGILQSATVLCAVALSLVSPCTIRAQCQQQWVVENQFAMLGPGYAEASTLYDPDQSGPLLPRLVVASSQIQTAGNAAVAGAASYDGVSWSPLGEIRGVRLLTQHGNMLVAAGSITLPGDPQTYGTAYWNGQSWAPLPGSAPTFNGQVNAMISDGESLYVAGAFGAVGTLPARVARYRNGAWSAVGENLSGAIRSMIIDNNTLVIAGALSVSGQGTRNVYFLGGGQWFPFTGLTFSAQALSLVGDDLYAASQFTSGNTNIYSLVRLNRQTLAFERIFSPLPLFANTVTSIVQHQGFLYVAGEFPLLVADDNTWRRVDDRPGIGRATQAYIWNNALYCVNQGFGPYYSAAAYDFVTRVFRPLGSGLIRSGTARPIIMYKGEPLFVAYDRGDGAARIDALYAFNGATWRPITAPFPAGFNVGIEYQGDIIVAGQFGQIDGTTFDSIARWDGQAWRPIPGGPDRSNPNTAPIINALCVYNGELIVGGYFELLGGAQCYSLAAWNGSRWRQLNCPFIEQNNGIEAMTTYNGELIVGGFFGRGNPYQANHIGRWDGTNWRRLGVGVTRINRDGGNVDSLTVYDGELIVTGDFDIAGGVYADNIARWTAADSWQPFTQPLAMGFIGATAVVNGRIFFSSDLATSPLYSWDGQSWNTHNVVGARSLAVRGRELYVGGSFERVDNRVSVSMARFGCPCRADFDADASVAVLDISRFLGEWFMGDLRADFDSSGTTDSADIFAFLNAWFIGC